MATTAPYEDEDLVSRRNVENVTHTVTGRIRRDADLTCAYPDLATLIGCSRFVFSRMPFCSSAVVYTLHVHETDKALYHAAFGESGRAQKVVVVRASWLPRKHCEELAREIYEEEELCWTAESTGAFSEGGMRRLLDAHPESVGLRLLVHHKAIRTLAQARDSSRDSPFPFKATLALTDAMLAWAAEQFASESDRFRLCFREAHGLQLPDMRRDSVPMTTLQDEAHRFYSAVKRETYEECHSVTDATNRVGDEALAWLLSNGVLARSRHDPTFVMLAEVARQETALLEALASIEESAPPAIADVDVSRTQLGSGKALCDEQELARSTLIRKPILVINGGAGSGKTDFLHVIPQLFEGRVMCTAFQGVNAGHMREISENITTTHKLLYGHARNHGPFNCAMRGVQVLVVDEVGTESLALLSGLLCAFALCGARNKKLVLVGDLGQLPPIGGPAPFRQLMEYFDRRGYLVRFRHNHRAAGERSNDGDPSIVADNANCIREGLVDDVIWNEDSFVRCPMDRDERPESALVRVIRRFDLGEKRFIVLTHRRDDAQTLSRVVETHFGGRTGPGAIVSHKFAFTLNDYERGTINNEILTLEGIEDRLDSTKRKRGVSFRPPRPQAANSTSDPRPRNTERYLRTSTVLGALRSIRYDGTVVGRVKKASAVTSNAMQGSGREVVVRVDFGPSRYSTRERLYTDVTRAERRFIYVGEASWFNEAIEREAPLPRSHLAELAALRSS